MSELVNKAQLFASQAHAGQQYDGGPYTKHLAAVAAVLTRYGVTDEELLCAAWLHDTVEDTPISVESIEKLFGSRVSDLVWRVTNEEGRNRKERHAKTYGKIAANKDAVTLKLADRIANVEASLASEQDFLGMYKKEFEGFKQALYTQGENEAMWAHLASLLQ